MEMLFLIVLILGISTITVNAYSRNSYCRAWKFTVEVNNLQKWKAVPGSCESFVAEYINGGQYEDDSEVAVSTAIAYAKSLPVHTDKKDAWVFDIDETSLSNVPYYATHHFGAEAFDSAKFNAWVEKAEAPARPATLNLYNKLKQSGFNLFFLTGRDENQRNVTIRNLLKAGYRDWADLILRQTEDQGMDAVAYKSCSRQALEDAGFVIVGNVGDQWSDLTGYSVGARAFKLPNPMYYIS